MTHFCDLADPKQDTHLLELLHDFTKKEGITLLNSGYTQDGVMADFRYSADHKTYVVEIREKK